MEIVRSLGILIGRCFWKSESRNMEQYLVYFVSFYEINKLSFRRVNNVPLGDQTGVIYTKLN